MTTSARRSYDFHGVAIEVRSAEPAVLAAMDLRLRDFRSGPHSVLAAVRIGFAVDPHPECYEVDLAQHAGRPVYDTPYGTLRYFSDIDVLAGTLGDVHLRCEPRRGVALIRSPQLSGRRLYFATHPLATVSLMELLERRGMFSLHSACLATRDGRGVILSGTSGAGKSTLSLALVRAGMAFLSDDVVFLAQDGKSGRVRALGFADTVGVTRYAAERFAELAGRLLEPPANGFPKRLARIEDLFGVSSTPSCEPQALVFPEVVPGGASRLEPLDPGEALLRLVPDVLVTDAAGTQAHLGAIAALLGRVRCYALRSGADLERAAELVRAIA
ncbi:MAG: hypothetical protein ACLP01_27690 [Solirubrobacteraceae bacterium]